MFGMQAVPQTQPSRRRSVSTTKWTPDQSETDPLSASSAFLPDKRAPGHQYTARQASFYEKVTCDTWILEIASLFVSLICTAVIGALLNLFDDRPIPELPRGLTLNATISILTTVCKACLLFTVASCVSQLKWIWYQRPRNLNDLQLFEDASKGPWGATQLLFRFASLRTPSLASLGALIICLSTLFDVFVQQTLTYPVREVLVDSNAAWVPQPQLFNMSSSKLDDLNTFSQFLNSGIFADNIGQFDRTPVCPSENCTWSTFSSVAWCTLCSGSLASVSMNCDTTDVEDIVLNTTTFGLKNVPGKMTTTTCLVDFGQGLNTSFELYTADLVTNREREMVYPEALVAEVYVYSKTPDPALLRGIQNTWPELSNPLGVFASVVLSRPTLSNQSISLVGAQICALDFCLQDLNISVVNGVSHIDTIGQRFGQKLVVQTLDEDGSVTPRDCVALTNNTEIQWTNVTSDLYPEIVLEDRPNFAWCAKFPFDWADDVANTIADTAYMSLENCSSQAVDCNDIATSPALNPFPEAPGQVSEIMIYIMQNGFEKAMIGAAAALTKYTWMQDANDAYGQIANPVVFTHARWLWLLLPAVSVVAGVVLLALTIALGRFYPGTPLWKSSLQALLFCGLENNPVAVVGGGGGGQSVTQSSLQVAADAIDVMIKRSEKDGRMVLG